MRVNPSPIVYVGPTLEGTSISRWLPGAEVMPPVRRGDLYHHRLLGFDVFVILDGVFFEQLAIPPREIIDVIQDGAIVFGASSMGALRAAECSPLGMRGVGTIYRLFRRGSLTSDDEVAVAFSPRPPYRAATVPLVNVRYAVRRAIRRGLMPAVDGERVVAKASAHHFTERDWHSILDVDGSATQMKRLTAFLQSHDLKALDGVRALKRVRSWLAERPRSARRSALSNTLSSRRPREPAYARGGRKNRLEFPKLWRWLVATGRYRWYAQRLLATFPPRQPTLKRPVRRRVTGGDTEATDHVDAAAEYAPAMAVAISEVAKALAGGRSSRDALIALQSYNGAAGRAVRGEIVAAGDTAALVLQFIAGEKAARRAREDGWHPDAAHWYLARTEIAQNHGFRTWYDLQDAVGADTRWWTAIEEAAEDTALGKCVRERLFSRNQQAVRTR